MKKSFIPLLLGVALLCVAASDFGNSESYLDYFETVWQTVNEKYFDSTFGGLDWNEVHARYQPLITAIKDDFSFYERINEMLFELKVSHLGVIPPGHWPLFEPTMFAEGSIGIDVRLLDGAVVITYVEPKSPGAQAGLRPSFVIQSIDGTTIERIAEESLPVPPYNERMKRNSVTSEILSRIYGPPETSVSIAYLDEHGETHEKRIMRRSRDGKSTLIDAMPPVFWEFSSRRLDNGIGYIRLNTLLPSVVRELLSAIESMDNAPGLIIDLRGSPGGSSSVGEALAGHLVGERTLFTTFRYRDRTIDVFIEPAESVYEGPVAVLIDVMNRSASEIFAAGIQAINRAVIVGERSPGCVTGADVMQLPNSASFIYPIVQICAPNGTVLEGHGVAPDIEVGLERALLMQGIDSQLEAAIKYIEKEVMKMKEERK